MWQGFWSISVTQQLLCQVLRFLAPKTLFPACTPFCNKNFPTSQSLRTFSAFFNSVCCRKGFILQANDNRMFLYDVEDDSVSSLLSLARSLLVLPETNTCRCCHYLVTYRQWWTVTKEIYSSTVFIYNLDILVLNSSITIFCYFIRFHKNQRKHCFYSTTFMLKL